MAFHDVLLPDNYLIGYSAGPGWATDVTVGSSGHEKRNQRWANPRRRFTVSTKMRSYDDFQSILEFFNARNGMTHSFLVRDGIDFSIADENIGTTDGVTDVYQITRAYGDAGGTYTRNVTKIRAGTDTVKLAGVATASYTLDRLTGIIEFTGGSPSVATAGQAITVTAQYDVTVRFNTDLARMQEPKPGGFVWPNIELIEVFGE